MSKDTRLAIVIPCYNEEGLIASTTDRLIEVIDDLINKGKVSPNSYIYMVNDGSADNTWMEIQKAAVKYEGRIKAAKFSTNFGNQKALRAGMLGANKIGCDALVTIDADLQDDTKVIEEMVDKVTKDIENTIKALTHTSTICTIDNYMIISPLHHTIKLITFFSIGARNQTTRHHD